jgi:hypothetical protein
VARASLAGSCAPAQPPADKDNNAPAAAAADSSSDADNDNDEDNAVAAAGRRKGAFKGRTPPRRSGAGGNAANAAANGADSSTADGSRQQQHQSGSGLPVATFTGDLSTVVVLADSFNDDGAGRMTCQVRSSG